jgi:hypothetical protein
LERRFFAIRNETFVRDADPLRFGFFLENGDAHFEFRRFDGDGKPPVEARYQTFFQSLNVFRVGIAGDDDLFFCFDQGVEGVEKLFLGSILAIEELDVVDQE